MLNFVNNLSTYEHSSIIHNIKIKCIFLTIKPIGIKFRRSQILIGLLATSQLRSVDDWLDRLRLGGSVKKRS